MIIIKLSEFKVSSQDLDRARTIFIQNQSTIYPVTNLSINKQRLILGSGKKQKPLNLNQFNQQTMKFDKNLILYLDKPEKLRIFGYRLEIDQIIFG